MWREFSGGEISFSEVYRENATTVCVLWHIRGVKGRCSVFFVRTLGTGSGFYTGPFWEKLMLQKVTDGKY